MNHLPEDTKTQVMSNSDKFDTYEKLRVCLSSMLESQTQWTHDDVVPMDVGCITHKGKKGGKGKGKKGDNGKGKGYEEWPKHDKRQSTKSKADLCHTL